MNSLKMGIAKVRKKNNPTRFLCRFFTQLCLFVMLSHNRNNSQMLFTKEQLAVFFMIPHRKHNVREELQPPSISPQPPPSLLGGGGDEKNEASPQSPEGDEKQENGLSDYSINS